MSSGFGLKLNAYIHHNNDFWTHLRWEYSYLSGGVPEADGLRGHQCRVHEIFLHIIIYTASHYDSKYNTSSSPELLGSTSACDAIFLLFMLVLL